MKAQHYGPLAPCTTIRNCNSQVVNCGLHDLPNLTSHQLLTHEGAKAFLRHRLPSLEHPTFIDLHLSLGNLDHLQVYINTAICTVHPFGTGWTGQFFSTFIVFIIY
ncbi:hypothetical protein BDP27DRAFT_1222153 [Rhodocollybia butyracea]|uniref:Uncharacterized protein n=1 Tax=Rhodocollybia butyracea TaxID=206335 RepID=A0A9P5U968_9AGAR|nr:hypothetical protein BDP27DRAFT_1222153 [Rhodocollybia butyracea]